MIGAVHARAIMTPANARGPISRFQDGVEYRVEPRFPVRSPIRVVVPGNPARVLNCDLIDVSATGMRFLSDQSVIPDEIVAVEVDSGLVLAEIRYCQPWGDKFVAGVLRLQEIPKRGELKDPGACATEIIRELRRHISAEGDPDSKALAMNALQKIVERSEISSTGNEPGPEAHPEPAPEGNGEADSHANTQATVEAGPEAPPEPNNVEMRPPEPLSLQPQPPPPPAATNVKAINWQATLGNATRGQRAETSVVADPRAPEPDEMPRHEPIREAQNEVPEAPGVREAPEALATGVADVPVADAPVETAAAEIEFHEPAAEAPFGTATVRERHAKPPIDETPLPEPVGTIPNVLEADVIDRDLLYGNVLPDHAIQGDRANHEAPPLAVVPAATRSAGIESRVPVRLALPPPRNANAARPPNALPAPADSRAARESDPNLAALRAEVMARYSAEVSSASARGPRSWRVPVGIAAALVLASTITFFLMQHRTQASSLAPPPKATQGETQVETHIPETAPSPAPAAPVVATPVVATPVVATPVVTTPGAAPPPVVPAASLPSPPSPDPTPAKNGGVHHVRINIVNASWVTIVADGGKPFQTMLYKGAVHEFNFSRRAFVRLGNAAGSEVTVDGASVGPLKGTVVVLQLTPEGVQYR